MSWGDFKRGLDRALPGGNDPYGRGPKDGYSYAYTPREAAFRTGAQFNPVLQAFGAVLPGTAGDFGVGAARIATGTVGQRGGTGGSNPTLKQAVAPIKNAVSNVPNVAGNVVENVTEALAKTLEELVGGFAKGLKEGLGPVLVVAAVVVGGAIILPNVLSAAKR